MQKKALEIISILFMYSTPKISKSSGMEEMFFSQFIQEQFFLTAQAS